MNTATRESDPFGFTAAPAFSGPGASTKQIKFIIKLGIERGVDLTDAIAEVNPDGSLKLDSNGEATPKISKRDASRKIEALLASKPTGTIVPPKSKAPVPDDDKVTEAGMYMTGSAGEIYKVQRAVHGSGRLYAKRLVVEGEGHDATAYFEMASGAIFKLRASMRMSSEEAKKFGELYGMCISCAATLTDEDSQYNSYGKKCASNNGWPYEKAPKIQIDK